VQAVTTKIFLAKDHWPAMAEGADMAWGGGGKCDLFPKISSIDFDDRCGKYMSHPKNQKMSKRSNCPSGKAPSLGGIGGSRQNAEVIRKLVLGSHVHKQLGL